VAPEPAESAHKFLVLEGTDGSGKTSLRKHVFQALKQQGREILTITPLSWRYLDATETIITAKSHALPVPPVEITRAYVRDKEALSDRIIRPQLRHRPVLVDRFIVSDMVYHHALWEIDPAQTYRAYCSSRVRFPDCHFFVDTPPQLAFERMLARGTGGRNRWDYLETQKRLYDTFQEVLFSGRFPALGEARRIDNSGDRAQTSEAWMLSVEEVLGQRAAPSVEGAS
jgi:dTMP kinase